MVYLAGIAQNAHVLDAFADAPDILGDQPHGAPDGGIGDISRTHGAVAGVDVECLCVWGR